MSAKTPDEIKKGLECCMVDECFGERENCPYTAAPNLCVGVMCADALAYIQQLEATVSEKEKVVAELSGKIGRLEVERNRLLEKIELLETTSEE